MRLLAATRNPAKLRELSRLFAGLATVEPAPVAAEHNEAGDGITDIARAKAAAWSLANPDAAVIASDGGLLIPALGGRWRPERTRRFAGDASDAARAAALVRLARGPRGDERSIGWRESVALAVGGDVVASWTAGSVPGLLATEVDRAAVARGGGFWIPALWLCPELGGRLLADLDEGERAARDDHWARLRAAIERDWPGLAQRFRSAS